MNDEIISISDIMMQTVNSSTSKIMKLPSVWRDVVFKVGKNNYKDDEEVEITFGEKLANNSHVVDLKNGVLLIEVNHSGWIQYLKMYQNFILKGLNQQLPDLKIKNLAFKVTGTQVSLSESYDEKLKKDQTEMNKKIEDEEKILDKIYADKKIGKKEPQKTKELPPEIAQRFESIRQSMLTKTNE